jgi:hypothetical protein
LHHIVSYTFVSAQIEFGTTVLVSNLSDEGIRWLAACYLRTLTDDTKRSESMVSNSNLILPDSGLEVWYTSGALAFRDGGLTIRLLRSG